MSRNPSAAATQVSEEGLEAGMLDGDGGSRKYGIKGVKYFWHSTRFWQYFAIMVLSNYFGTFFSYSYKAFGESSKSHDGISDSTLTWAASIGAGGVNGLSRVINGNLVDRFSFRSIMMVLMTIQLVNSLLCFWAAYIPALFFICVLINYMVIGGIFATFPVSVQNCFGLEFGPQIYVWILFGGFVCSILNLITTKWLLPATNFITLFYIGSLTQIAVLVMLYYFKEELDIHNLVKHDAIKVIKAPKKED